MTEMTTTGSTTAAERPARPGDRRQRGDQRGQVTVASGATATGA
ncbi:hypothetical protein [Streptomyces sp. NPDC056291]